MTRVSDLASSNLLLSYLVSVKQRVEESEVKIASGKITQTYSGIALNSQRLVGLENTVTLYDRFMQDNKTAEIRMKIADDVYGSVFDSINDFKKLLHDFRNGTINQSNVNTIQDAAFDALRSMQNLLNTEADGRFLFSGARVSTLPVNLGLTTLSDFQTKYDGITTTYPTTRAAHLAEANFAADTNYSSGLFVDNSNWLTFRQDDDGNSATSGTSSIEATSAMFGNLQAGSTFTVSGTTSNDGTYTVSSVSADKTKIYINTEMLTSEVVAAGGEFTLTDGTLVGDTATGSVTFNRAANTIVATNASAFSGASAGEVITVSGTTENNGTYTIQSVSADGKTVTIDSNYLTDEGLSSGNAFFDYTTDSQVVFNTAGTITVQDTGGGNLAGAFGGLKVGDTITVAGAPTAGNNTTYTISAISNSPNSQITVTPVPVANETDTNGTVFTATGYSYTASTRLEYTSTNTVQVQDNAGTPVANVFANLRVGQTITLSGSPPNNGAQIITAINNTTSEITVSGTPFTVGTDTDGANIKVYAEDGTITASSSYYYGDDVDRNHRVDLQRNFDFDVNAIDPAFEKAIRAMGIIAQGVFGTEGGLDQNSSRADDALYLLKSALDLTDGTPPYGAELDSNMAELELALVFDQLTLSRATEKHIQLLSFSKGTIGDIENIDSAEVISKLLADSNALEASYKAISRVRGLSLADYL